MAVEYQVQAHVFGPDAELNREPDDESGIQLCEESDDKSESTAEFFSFNFYHDLESVYWIYLWFLHYRLPRALPPSTKAELKDRKRKLFTCGINGSRFRHLFITTPEGFKAVKETLRNTYGTFGYLVHAINFRRTLVKAYKDIEATDPVEVNGVVLHWDKAVFQDEPYDTLSSLFRQILDHMGKRDDSTVMVNLPLKITLPQTSRNKAKGRALGEETVHEGALAMEEIETLDGEPSTSKPKQKFVALST